jgi:hypothetical protein
MEPRQSRVAFQKIVNNQESIIIVNCSFKIIQ